MIGTLIRSQSIAQMLVKIEEKKKFTIGFPGAAVKKLPISLPTQWQKIDNCMQLILATCLLQCTGHVLDKTETYYCLNKVKYDYHEGH